MSVTVDVTQTVEKFDVLIQFALEHLELMRGTIYEKYAESLLEAIIREREEYIARVERSN